MFAGPRKVQRGGQLKPGRRSKPQRLPLVALVVLCLSVVAYAIRPEEDVQALSIQNTVHEPLVLYPEQGAEPEQVGAPESAEGLESEEPVVAPVEAEPEKPSVFQGVIAKNQTITASLQGVLGLAAIHDIINATAKFIDFRRSKPGDEWVVELGDEGEVARFEYAMSAEDRWVPKKDSKFTRSMSTAKSWKKSSKGLWNQVCG